VLFFAASHTSMSILRNLTCHTWQCCKVLSVCYTWQCCNILSVLHPYADLSHISCVFLWLPLGRLLYFPVREHFHLLHSSILHVLHSNIFGFASLYWYSSFLMVDYTFKAPLNRTLASFVMLAITGLLGYPVAWLM